LFNPKTEKGERRTQQKNIYNEYIFGCGGGPFRSASIVFPGLGGVLEREREREREGD